MIEDDGNDFERPQSPVIKRRQTVEISFTPKKDSEKMIFEDFSLVKEIARGGCSKVYLVKNNKTQEYFAMKSIRKDFVIKHDMIDCLKNEKSIMLKATHPFILKLTSYFELPYRVYFLMPFYPGGSLTSHFRRVGSFSEDETRFFAAQIALAFVHLHSKGIVYRDLKPDNILVQEDGYLMLADFGIAASLRRGQSSFDFCGTIEYMAPEMISNDKGGHSFPFDWWSFGILLYELLNGFTPFHRGDAEKQKILIVTKRHNWPIFKNETPYSQVAIDFVNQLLNKDPKKRLGSKDSSEVLNHEFFNGIDFKMILEKKIQPPWRPVIKHPNIPEDSIIAESVIHRWQKDIVNANQDYFQDY
ncbi:hypothetical protein FGO68_gene17743 [Halteria grandinella]|uniref:Uncharacterized protein n=1 Tax=Halteria grandinella TaxID=5974 RepID=A0A8J8NZC2_HALGN|nr:hypothetical protein FGO68_gene17743 [Halteria grandinella]